MTRGKAHHGDTKVCKDCGVEKSLDEFYLTTYAKQAKKPNTQSRMPCCKSCSSVRSKVWYAANKTHHQEIVKARADFLRAQDPQKWEAERRRAYLRHLYDLTPEEWDGLYDRQLGRCAVCLVPLAEVKINVDHCHQTGVVRGLLCPQCNVGIGNLGDDPTRLRRAADYLDESRLKKGQESMARGGDANNVYSVPIAKLQSSEQ